MTEVGYDVDDPSVDPGDAERFAAHDQRPSDLTLILSALVWPILGDIVIPFLLYVAGRQLGLSTLLALLLGSFWFIARMLISVLRGTRIDRLSVFVLVLIVAGIAAALVSGSARFTVMRDSAFTGVIGFFFLGARISGRSIMAPAFRPLVMGKSEGGIAFWNDCWERSTDFRRLFNRLDTVWGCGLLLEATIRIVAALLLPVSVVVSLSGALMAVTFILLACWNGVQGKALGRLFRAEGLVPPDTRHAERRVMH